MNRRGPFLPLAAAAAVAAAALLLPALIRGHGLLPVGSLWRIPPWNHVLPPTPGNPLLADQLLEFWPWRLFLRSEWLSGHFPLWNPLIDCGVPFAGCVQAALFFPTTWLLAVLSPAAWSLAAAFLKLFVAGLFTSLHARRLGAGRTGAMLAGVSFALCGFMVAWLGHPQTNVACLLPALFWALGRAAEGGARRAWAGAAAVIGLILLGGHPPTALHVLAAGAAFLFFCERRGWPRAAWAGACGAALAAPALLPYFEYLPFSSTAASSATLARWSARLAPGALLHLAMPLASGSPARGAEVLGAAFGLGPGSNFLERAGYVGLTALAFAALAVARKGRAKAARFHAGLALFGLAGAFGVPPLPWLWRVLPFVSAANPQRLILLFSFGAAVLAGLGCDDDGASASTRERAWFLAACAVALLVDVIAAGRIAADLTAAEKGFALGQAAAFLAESLAVLWLLAVPRARRWAPLVAAISLLRVGWGINPSAPASLLYPRTSALEALVAAQGEGRVLGLGASLAPDAGMALGLRDARGQDFTTVRRYEEVVTGRSGDFDFYRAASGLPPSTALLGVSAIFDGEARFVRVPGCRALFVPRARSAGSAAVLAAARTPGFDPAREVWLDDGAPVPQAAGARGEARIVADRPDEVVVSVRSDGPGWLLLLDTWYPGWRAEIDGRRVPVRRADYAFRAVFVPAGSATVRFAYAPLSFRIGVALSGAAALSLAFL